MKTLDQELEIALRAETPRPSAEFLTTMDERLAAGFPRKQRFQWNRKPLMPALAVAASLLIVLVIVVSVNGGGGSTDQTSAGSGSVAAKESAPATAGGNSSAASSVAPTVRQPAVPPLAQSPSRVRRVERSAALTLGAPASKLEDVANQVIAVTDRHHGFVLHSTVTSGGSSTGGSFELRVPSGQLQATLADLSNLADVRSRTQASSDITAPYNAVSSRLDEARALRHSLLARLAKATTDTEAEALRNRIHLANAQIRSLSAQFARLQTRARLATIDVTLVRERAHHGGAAGGVSGAFHDGLHSLAVSFGIALRVLGVVLPLALVAALGWLGASVLKRRRREAALF